MTEKINIFSIFLFRNERTSRFADSLLRDATASEEGRTKLLARFAVFVNKLPPRRRRPRVCIPDARKLPFSTERIETILSRGGSTSRLSLAKRRRRLLFSFVHIVDLRNNAGDPQPRQRRQLCLFMRVRTHLLPITLNDVTLGRARANIDVTRIIARREEYKVAAVYRAVSRKRSSGDAIDSASIPLSGRHRIPRVT